MKNLSSVCIVGLWSKKRNEVDYFIEFAQKSWLYFLVPLIILSAIFVYRFKKKTVYRYSLGSVLAAYKKASQHRHAFFLYLLRFLLLCLLALIAARPLLVDSRSEVSATGIDMVLALDLSGSMMQQDSQGDER